MKKSLSAAALSFALLAGLTACGDGDDLSPEDRRKATQAALAATGSGFVTDVSREDDDDEGYEYKVDVTFANGVDIKVLLDGDFNVINSPPTADTFNNSDVEGDRSGQQQELGTAPGFDNRDLDEWPLTGDTLKKASDAALKATGGGKVIETRRSDDADHVYEVVVIFPNGEDVRVELDKSFNVTDFDR